MSNIDKKPLATGTLEQEIAEINLLLSEVGIRLRALGLRLVCSIEEEQTQRDNNAPLLKQSMKLYTEEQMKEAIKIALHGFGIGGIEDTIEVVASKFTPIELPTDEEKREFTIDFFNWLHTNQYKYNPKAKMYQKFMINETLFFTIEELMMEFNKIQGGNK